MVAGALMLRAAHASTRGLSRASGVGSLHQHAMAASSTSKRSRADDSGSAGAKRRRGGTVNPARVRTLNDNDIGDGPIMYCERRPPRMMCPVRRLPDLCHVTRLSPVLRPLPQG